MFLRRGGMELSVGDASFLSLCAVEDAHESSSETCGDDGRAPGMH